jgi:hypothetical protein
MTHAQGPNHLAESGALGYTDVGMSNVTVEIPAEVLTLTARQQCSD